MLRRIVLAPAVGGRPMNQSISGPYDSATILDGQQTLGNFASHLRLKQGRWDDYVTLQLLIHRHGQVHFGPAAPS